MNKVTYVPAVRAPVAAASTVITPASITLEMSLEAAAVVLELLGHVSGYDSKSTFGIYVTLSDIFEKHDFPQVTLHGGDDLPPFTFTKN